MTMVMTNKCPVCGAGLEIKQLEHLIKEKNNVVAVVVAAGVCHKCGEVVFDSETIERFEEIRRKLIREDVRTFTPIGTAFVA